MTASAAQRTLQRAQREQWENHLATRLMQMAGIPDGWQRQARWHPTRRFVADFCWPAHRLIVEVDGGTFSAARSGHSTGAGIARDMTKANEAALHGWTLLRFDAAMVRDDVAVLTIARWFEQKGATA